MSKKDYALKMVRIPRGRSGQLANEEASVTEPNLTEPTTRNGRGIRCQEDEAE